MFAFQQKTKTDDDPSSFEESQVDRAKRIMKPFVLRRLKKDVLQFLPKKSEVIVRVLASDLLEIIRLFLRKQYP